MQFIKLILGLAAATLAAGLAASAPQQSSSAYASTPFSTYPINRTIYSCDGPVHVTAPLCAAFCAGQNNTTTDCCVASACVTYNTNNSPGEGFCDCRCGGDPALPAAGLLDAPTSPGEAYKDSSCPVSTDFACNMDADDNSLCVAYCAGHKNSFAQHCEDSTCLPNRRSGESFCNCACTTPPGPMQTTVLPFPTSSDYPLPGSSTLSPVVERAIASEPPKPATSDVTSYSCGGMSSVAKPFCVAYCSGLYNATADCCGDSLCASSSEGSHCVCLCNVTH
ncbi:hypothetical protein MPH_05006 [Macrophomina phaseolina MS6]|uniref:Extracellular membrane protein CFEM domain-containing protein n=1 Tax=Macrophomina phaseolina (strain MS6) TaxID=1126212 RepID=K2RYF8_MACPH|nr:hypothetical protein MPH_05006 [Macrophomina phaseolina MS6]